MIVKLKKISEENLEKNGWEKLGDYNYNWYHKEINNLHAEINIVAESSYECEVPDYQDVTPNDLIAIGNELKKLEASS